jgi:hypothetical protein
MSTVYFCFICDRPAAPGLEAEHYEDGRTIRFCSAEHKESYAWLHDL